MRRRVTSLSLAVAAMVLAPSLARATTFTDPATLHIGTGAGTGCAMGCGGDPNVVSPTNLDIYQNSGGAAGLNNPVLLILAVANDTTNIFGTNPIASVTFYNPYPGGTADSATSFAPAVAGTYGLKTSSPSDAFFGSMTASSPDVYTFLTLNQPADNSNNFVNMAGADKLDENITATSFGIYVFAITNNNVLGANGLIDIKFKNALPTGTFAFAYGQDTKNSKIYDTPFTESGLTGGNVTTLNAVPEPASLMLLGSGLLIAGTKFRKKRAAKGLKSAVEKTLPKSTTNLPSGAIA
jgi:hypothetical protein